MNDTKLIIAIVLLLPACAGSAWGRVHAVEQRDAKDLKAAALDGSSYYSRAVCNYDLKRYDQAIIDLTNAEKRGFRQAELYALRGQCFLAQKKYDEAMNAIDYAIKLQPDNPQWYYLKAQGYEGLGDLKAAGITCVTALNLKPQLRCSEMFMFLTRTCFKRRAYKDTIKAAKGMLGLEPNCAEAHRIIGISYQHLKQHDLALPHFDAIIKLSPNDNDAYFHRGCSYYALAENEKAIEDFTKVISQNPTFGEAYYMRGNSFKELGLKSQAQSDQTKAESLGYLGPFRSLTSSDDP